MYAQIDNLASSRGCLSVGPTFCCWQTAPGTEATHKQPNTTNTGQVNQVS